MTPAGPEKNKRQACDQSEANWPEKPVHGSGERSRTERKQSEEGQKDDSRDDSPVHGCGWRIVTSPIIPYDSRPATIFQGVIWSSFSSPSSLPWPACSDPAVSVPSLRSRFFLSTNC